MAEGTRIFQFRRSGMPELMRRVSFVGMAAAIGWLLAVQNASNRAHEGQVEALEKRVDDLSTVVRLLGAQQTGQPSSTPLIITVPADEARGTPERVILVPGATTTTAPERGTGSTPSTTTASSTTTTTAPSPTTTVAPTTTTTTRCDASVRQVCITVP